MKKSSIIISVFLLLVLFNSCKEDPVGSAPIFVPGVNGKITDAKGNGLDNVNIFYLFQERQTSNSVQQSSKLNRTAKPDSFGFNLEQNFPNPVLLSTYIRFSLPQECYTSLKIQKKGSGVINEVIRDTLPAGYYQFYISNMVDSLNLSNGIYYYSIKAVGTSGIEYAARKEMFIVSLLGIPNAKTDSDGKFTIPFSEFYIGDTVVYRSSADQLETVTKIISNPVRIYCKKSGFYPSYVDLQMTPSLLLNHDIVLDQYNP